MTDEEKNASIDFILSRGLQKPLTARARIREMVGVFGLRFLFWDTAYSLFFTAVTLAAALTLSVFAPKDYSHSVAVGAAPLLFFCIVLFAETSERVCSLYELGQTGHYTVRQITALRVLCYSAPGTVFAIVSAAMNVASAEEFLTLLPLCLSMLFLCALIQLSGLRFLRNPWATTAISAALAFGNVMLPFTLGLQWEAFLREFPLLAGASIALLTMTMFGLQVRKMLTEEKNYAIA